VDLFDIGQTDWFVIRFGRRHEDRSKADVIGALGLRGERLGEAVSRFADQNRAIGLCACGRNRIVILADVHALNRNFARHLGTIVHDQWHRRRSCDLVEFARKIDKLVNRLVFATELNQIHSAADHCLGDAADI
jgi:hypothetical protein